MCLAAESNKSGEQMGPEPRAQGGQTQRCLKAQVSRGCTNRRRLSYCSGENWLKVLTGQ